MSDGPDETGLVDDLANGDSNSSPGDLLFVNHMLFFASSGETGQDRELWMFFVP